MIVGFRGGNGVFLAMQRGEVNIHSTSIATFRGRTAGFIKSGEGVGIAYLVPVDKEGRYQPNALITEMPSFPDLYKDVHGRMPSGPTWDAFNWLTNQFGELTYIVVAPPRTPAALVAALRQGFEGVGFAYLVPVDKDGRYARNPLITEMPAFPDLYQEVHGRMPSGPTWDAFELTYIIAAPPRTPAGPIAALRQGFEGAARDPAFERELMARQGIPYSHIGTAQGQSIFRSLAEVSPGVIRTLHDSTKGP